MPCPICLENEIKLPITLAACGHEFCKECLERWICQLEASNSSILLLDPTNLCPTCPKCRCTLSDEESNLILGRPLLLRQTREQAMPSFYSSINHIDNGGTAASTNGTTTTNADNNNSYDNNSGDAYEASTILHDYFEPGDEFTKAYLEDLEEKGEARRCPSCRVWIIKESGCHNLVCLCGCKFCFCCGKRGACEGGYFFDNIRRHEDYTSFIPRSEGYEEEDEEISIYGLFEQGEDWFIEYNHANIEPLFQGDKWMPHEEEIEESNIVPLFQGDWNVPAIFDPAPPGIFFLENFIKENFTDLDDDEEAAHGFFLLFG